MADIFVSYARADQARVAPLVTALERQGFSVWWDPAMTPGQEFDQRISAELDAAKCVIVVWTPLSVDSRWVRGEAREAADRNVLVPVRFENARLPIDVRSLHTTDLDTWREDIASAPFQELLRALNAFVHPGDIAVGAADARVQSPRAATVSPAMLKRFKLWHAGVLAGALILVAVVLTYLLANRGNEIRATTPAASPAVTASQPGAPAKPRIAVLPFENFSPDPANAFFTDGMHEEILTALSDNAPGLEVVSRTTMMTYKGKQVTAHQVAQTLGATHVLEGSVRREGDHVRVTLQLIDGATDNHIWSKDYDRTLSDALTLQTEVANAVADQLSIAVLQAARNAMPPTSSTKAYDIYLKANLAYGALNFVSLSSAFKAVDDQAKEALALDPDFALAHLLRAGICEYLFSFNHDVSDQNVAQWRAELDAAAQLAPDTADTLAQQANFAYLVDRDLLRALQLYEQVEAKGLINPPALVGKTTVLLAMGRVDEAIAVARRIYQADPQNFDGAVAPVQSFWLSRRTKELFEVINNGPSRFTPLPRMAAFYFTGAVMDQPRNVPPPGSTLSANDSGTGLILGFDFSRMSGSLADFKAAIDKVPFESVGVGSFVIFPVAGVGDRPLAEVRGWTDLLMGDKAGAAAQAAGIRAFLAKTKETRWNSWFLRMLMADAALFSGDKAEAIAKAEEAMDQLPCSLDAVNCLYPKFLGAQVLAWAGDEAAAVAVLESLSFDIPGLPPAVAARDPIFAIPLANNARYKSLKAKLEAQMAANKLEL